MVKQLVGHSVRSWLRWSVGLARWWVSEWLVTNMGLSAVQNEQVHKSIAQSEKTSTFS